MKRDACNLTPRQTEVMELLTEGLTSKEAAYRLGISHKTAEIHVARLMKAMGTRNRSHAMLMWDRAQRERLPPSIHKCERHGQSFPCQFCVIDLLQMWVGEP